MDKDNMGKKNNKLYVGKAKSLNKEMTKWAIVKANSGEEDKEDLAIVTLEKHNAEVMVTMETLCMHMKNVYRREVGSGGDRFNSLIQTYRQPVLCMKVSNVL